MADQNQFETTAAEQFGNLGEREQEDFKYEAWSRTISTWADEHPGAYDLIESSSNVSWGGMDLEIYQDENRRDYFHVVTGVQYAPGHENGKRLFETVHDLMGDYRDELIRLVKDR